MRIRRIKNTNLHKQVKHSADVVLALLLVQLTLVYNSVTQYSNHITSSIAEKVKSQHI